MNRLFGICLLSIGIFIVLAALVGLAAVVVNQNGLTAAVMGPLLVMLAGAIMILLGSRIMRSAPPVGSNRNGSVPRVGNYLPDQIEKRWRGEMPFEVFYQLPVKGKNGRPSSLSVSVPVAVPTTLAFSAENWFDRMCKRIGIAREHQTGDTDFDEVIYIRGPSYAYAERFLEDPAKRTAILDLKTQGFPVVKLTGERAEAIWTGFDPQKQDREGLADEAAQRLFVLTERHPPDDPELTRVPGDRHVFWLTTLWILLSLFTAMALFVFVFPALRDWELIKIAFLLYLVVLPAFGWMSAFLIRGRANSHDRWAVLVGFGVFLIAFGCAGTTAAINGLTDDSPDVEHKSTITSKRISTGRRGSKSYHVTVSAWDRPGDTLEFRVSSSEYDAIAEHRSELEVVTGAGVLGIEWIRTQRVWR